MQEELDLNTLSDEDRARVVSTSRLLRHLKGLENAKVLNQQEAGKLIGAVKILDALAQGTFVPHRN